MTPTLADHIVSLYASFHATRVSRGVSLRQVAEETGVSFNTLSRFERGQNVHLSVAVAVARWLEALPPYGDTNEQEGQR